MNTQAFTRLIIYQIIACNTNYWSLLSRASASHYKKYFIIIIIIIIIIIKCTFI